LRGAVALLLSVVAIGVNAQVSGTATVVSDYRYRGVTLSDQKPAAQLGVSYDDPAGWYAGAFGSTVRLASPAGPGVQVLGFAGYATRLPAGVTLEAGGDYSAFTSSMGSNYGEVYAGATWEGLSARIYYSPTYYGSQAFAVYGELNGAQTIVEHLRLVAHVGLLNTRSAYIYGYTTPKHIVDGRIGLSTDLDLFRIEVAWVGISSTYVAYGVTGSSSPNTVVLTISRAF
jgi:uncharacterized protein (TIGR02001 family)